MSAEFNDMVNLSSCVLSHDEKTVLLKGLSFCPDRGLDIFECVKDLNLFSRKLTLKVLLDKSKTNKPNYAKLFKGYTVADFRALQGLILLMQESKEISSLDVSILNQDISSLMDRSKELTNEQSISKYKPKF